MVRRISSINSPSIRGRRGGLLNRGPHHKVKLVHLLRKLLPLGRSYSEIKDEVSRLCPWSKFDYDIFTKTYLPRFKRGSL